MGDKNNSFNSGDIFRIDECSNIEKNYHEVYDIVSYGFNRILLNRSVIYEIHFVILNAIRDYWRREKKSRYELDRISYYIKLEYDEYAIMRHIINSEGIKGFENFLQENIKEYFTEIYNNDMSKEKDVNTLRGNIDESIIKINRFQDIIEDIDNPEDIIGERRFKYLGIGDDVEKQKELIQKLIVKAY